MSACAWTSASETASRSPRSRSPRSSSCAVSSAAWASVRACSAAAWAELSCSRRSDASARAASSSPDRRAASATVASSRPRLSARSFSAVARARRSASGPRPRLRAAPRRRGRAPRWPRRDRGRADSARSVSFWSWSRSVSAWRLHFGERARQALVLGALRVEVLLDHFERRLGLLLDFLGGDLRGRAGGRIQAANQLLDVLIGSGRGRKRRPLCPRDAASSASRRLRRCWTDASAWLASSRLNRAAVSFAA